MIGTPETAQSQVNWRQSGLFVGLTFTFTYLLDLLLRMAGGLRSSSAIVFLKLQMLRPAFFAIFLGLFVFSDSPFYFRNPMPDGRRDRARGLFYLYMALTLIVGVQAAIMALAPGPRNLVSQLGLLVWFVGLLGLVMFRALHGREAFARTNLHGGRLLDWIVYGGAIVAFLVVQTGMNAFFHLGAGRYSVHCAIGDAGFHVPDLRRLSDDPHRLADRAAARFWRRIRLALLAIAVLLLLRDPVWKDTPAQTPLP